MFGDSPIASVDEIARSILQHDLLRPFTPGATYGQVFSLAHDLLERMAVVRGPVCVASADRTVIAAAVLASFLGGPELVFPYGFSRMVLQEAKDALGFDAALGSDKDVPEGVKSLTVKSADHYPSSSSPMEPGKKESDPIAHLFTGGSTGKPRSWIKTVSNLLGEALYMRRRFSFESSDVFLSTVPANHIYGLLFSVLAPMLSGSMVVEHTAYLPAEIAGLMSTVRPSVFVSGPAHFRTLAQDKMDVPRLRLATSSGSMLDGSDGLRFLRATGVGIVEIYGSTETGGVGTRSRSDGEEHWTPLDIVRCKSKGGRLCVASPFLSPDLDVDDDGFFVTSDRIEPAGQGRFILRGRVDGVVKVAGKRVDLLEVEQIIRTLGFVKDAHVLSVPNRKRGSTVVAMVVCDSSAENLRSVMKQRMASHLVPRRIEIVESIPRTEVGKPDRQRILEMIR